MSKEFHQITWDEQLQSDWDKLLQLAVAEDLGEAGDWTTAAVVPEDTFGRARVVAREPGIVAGLPAVESTLREIDPCLQWKPEREDGQPVEPGDQIGMIEGPARGLLVAERLLLNVLGRLSGIATLTRKYVDAVEGAKARIYDTRKTTPGWRRLEKYAVRCGGGWNHRSGLFEAVLIKDNHLTIGAESAPGAAAGYSPAEAVARARRFVHHRAVESATGEMIVEVEVDTLRQLDEVLPAGPDIVLLDNMRPLQLRKAVARRDACNPAIELEASGEIDLKRVRRIAQTGVERISVGALTHSAAWLDLALDWAPDRQPGDVAKS